MEAQVSTASVSDRQMVAFLRRQRHRQKHPRDAASAQHRAGRGYRQAGQLRRAHLEQSGQVQIRRRLYPVNSRRETIWGVPCYKDFASLPDKPDHVLVLVPARFAVQVIRDAAAAGARSATIVTSGFSELQDDESQRLAAELQQAIRETGLAVTGPNCLGNLSAGENMFTNIDDRIVTMEAGPVAIAGQSGAIVMAIRQALEDRGVGVGYMVTTGNEAGLETPDLMSLLRGRSIHSRHRGLSGRRAQHQGIPRRLQGRARRRQAGDRAQAGRPPRADAPPPWRTLARWPARSRHSTPSRPGKASSARAVSTS